MAEKERKLTKQEERRKKRFEALSEELGQQGYERRELLISIVRGNIYGVLSMIPFIVLHVVLFWRYSGFTRSDYLEMTENPFTGIELVIIMLLCLVVHELIHGLTWGIFAEHHFQAIEFGVIWKMLTPYCTCSEPMKKWQYLMGSAMPTILLGFGMGVLSIFTGNLMLCELAAIMLLGGGGDFLIILKLLRYRTEKRETRYLDHPYELGLVVFEK